MLKVGGVEFCYFLLVVVSLFSHHIFSSGLWTKTMELKNENSAVGDVVFVHCWGMLWRVHEAPFRHWILARFSWTIYVMFSKRLRDSLVFYSLVFRFLPFPSLSPPLLSYIHLTPLYYHAVICRFHSKRSSTIDSSL